MPSENDWVARVQTIATAPWWAFLAAFLPGFLPMIWKSLSRWWSRHQATTAVELDAEAKERAQIAADRQARADELRTDIGDLRGENARLWKRIREIEQDRDQWADRARAWHVKAKEATHDLANVVHGMGLVCDRAGIGLPPEYAAIPRRLPGLEEIETKNGVGS